MHDELIQGEPGRISRREVLRRSALVGGALAWTVPAVQTLATPAFASGSPAGENPPCTYTAFVKYDLGGGFSGSEGNGNDTCRLEQCAASNVSVVATGALSASLVAGGATIGTVAATIDPANGNCVYLDFAWTNGCNVDESSSYYIFKDGNDTGTGGAGCEPDDSGLLTDAGVTVDPSGDRYHICSDGGRGGGLSHVNLCVCIKCPTA